MKNKYWVVIDRETNKIVSTFADGAPILWKSRKDAFYTPEYCYGNNKYKYKIVRAELKLC